MKKILYSTLCAFGVVGILMSQISVQTASAAAAIQIGHTVQVSAILRIRATPGLAGAILGHENVGTKGTVVDGPQTADNLTWMKVKYADNFVGWSTTDYLVDMGQNTQAPSQDGKYLTSSSGTLTDNFGNVWAISAAKTVIKNGNASEVPDFTSGAVFLLWYSNSLYYEAQGGGAVQWWNWNGQTWVQIADDPRPIGNRPGVSAGSTGGTTAGVATVTLTVAPSTISPGGSAIITWISSNATSCTGFNFTPTALSGVTIVHPANTTTYAITCGSASAQGVLAVAGTQPSTLPSTGGTFGGDTGNGSVQPQTSIGGSSNIYASATQGNGSLTDFSGDIWTISAGGAVLKNGQTVDTGTDTVLIVWANNTIYKENSANSWSVWVGFLWSPVLGDPRGTSAVTLPTTLTLRTSKDVPLDSFYATAAIKPTARI